MGSSWLSKPRRHEDRNLLANGVTGQAKNVGPCMVRFIPDMQNVHHRDEERYRVRPGRKWRRLWVRRQRFWPPCLPPNTRTLWVSLRSGASLFCTAWRPREDAGQRGGGRPWWEERRGANGFGRHGEQVAVQPVRALPTHGRSTAGAIAQRERSSSAWTQFFFSLKTVGVNAELGQCLSVYQKLECQPFRLFRMPTYCIYSYMCCVICSHINTHRTSTRS